MRKTIDDLELRQIWVNYKFETQRVGERPYGSTSINPIAV